MDHTKAPLYEKLLEHSNLQSTSFHVPGHKAGIGLDPLAAARLEGVMSIDYTELTGLDDLHQPEGVIREAERLAADCFNADHSFLLVGGSTVGNLATILSMCQKGQHDLFIVQRNVHKSIIHGLMLARAQAVFLAPQVDEATGIAAGISLVDVGEALKQYPNAVGVILTNPNYYGMGIDLQAIIECVHASGIPVLVDEAHGAHYGFHPDIPQSALSAGADAVVQSTHKMLTAMTMGAMLHLKGNRIHPQTVRQQLSVIQSSSPSYPILASLDLSRRQLKLRGRALLNQALEGVEQLHQGLSLMPWFQLVGHELHSKLNQTNQLIESGQVYPINDSTYNSRAYTTLDPLKITLADRTRTLSGSELQRQLERHRCYPEMADPYYVLLVLSLATRVEDVSKLLLALRSITDEFGLDQKELAESNVVIHTWAYTAISQPTSFSLQTNQAINGDSNPHIVEVSVEEAIDALSQQAITPYPPGIPIIYPGERVTAVAAEQLRIWLQAGARIHGLTENGKILIHRGGNQA